MDKIHKLTHQSSIVPSLRETNRRRDNVERVDRDAQQRQFFAINRQNRRLQRANAFGERSVYMPPDPQVQSEVLRPRTPKPPGPAPIPEKIPDEKKFLNELQASEASVPQSIPPIQPLTFRAHGRPHPPIRQAPKPPRTIKRKEWKDNIELFMLRSRRADNTNLAPRVPLKKRRRQTHQEGIHAPERPYDTPFLRGHKTLESGNDDEIVIFDGNEDKTRLYRRPVLSAGFLNSERTPSPPMDSKLSLPAADRMPYRSSSARLNNLSPLRALPPRALESERNVIDPFPHSSLSRPRNRSRIYRHNSSSTLTGDQYRRNSSYLALSNSGLRFRRQPSPLSQENGKPSLTNDRSEAESLMKTPLSPRPESSNSLSFLLRNQRRIEFPKVDIAPDSPPRSTDALLHGDFNCKMHPNFLSRLPWDENKKSLQLVYFEHALLLKPDVGVPFFVKKRKMQSNSSFPSRPRLIVRKHTPESKTIKEKEQENMEEGNNTNHYGKEVDPEETQKPDIESNFNIVEIELPPDIKNPIAEAADRESQDDGEKVGRGCLKANDGLSAR